MDLPAGVNRRYASLAGCLLVAVWCWVAFDRPYTFPHHIPWNVYSNSPQAAPIIDVFDYAPLVSLALKTDCSNTHWNESITFVCNESSGSFAEVRNSILGCVRYTIVAGASLVVPGIVLGQRYGDLDAGNVTEMEYMFDTSHFLQSLALSCPQLRIYKTAADVRNLKAAYGPISLLPDSLIKEKLNPEHTFPGEWRGQFYKRLTQYLSPDAQGPIIVELGRAYFDYPIASDGEGFAVQFGKILKIRSDARSLATMTLLKLSQTYSLILDVSEPVLKGVFLGAYLSTFHRGEDLSKDDRINVRYETQSKLYLEQATRSNLSVIYVASQIVSEIPQFINDATLRDIAVTSKLDLLKGNDRDIMLRGMTSDQQELVDFLVMSKAAEFVGVGMSSFSWSVALKRRQSTHKKDYLHGTQTLNDGLSHLYGDASGHSEFPSGMWP